LRKKKYTRETRAKNLSGLLVRLSSERETIGCWLPLETEQREGACSLD
jgi:hypothetical protein